MEDVRQANAAIGHHWFSPDTVRFFNSRIGRSLYGGRYFVTSERYEWDAPRLYTVRRANADGTIDTVGEFQGYATSYMAKRAIRELMAEGL